MRLQGVTEIDNFGRPVPERSIRRLDESNDVEFAVATATVPSTDGSTVEALDVFFSFPLSDASFGTCVRRPAPPPELPGAPDAPDAPEAPEAPEAAEGPDAPEAPEAPEPEAPAPAAKRALMQTETTPADTTPAETPPAGGTRVEEAERRMVVHALIFSDAATIDTTQQLLCGLPYDCPTDVTAMEPACDDGDAACVPAADNMCKIDCEAVAVDNAAAVDAARGTIVPVGKNSIKVRLLGRTRSR